MIDKGVAKKHEGDDLLWYDIRNLEIEGKGWTNTKHFFDRFPAYAEGVVRDPVWELSTNSAGMCARFVTDATTIGLNWTVRSGELAMDHFASTGVSGVDLYVKHDGEWRWIFAGRLEKELTNESVLEGISPGEREYMLYLPLYNGAESIEVGIPADASFAKAPEREPKRAKPICFYGTSITQGGCASRPGMAYPAIVGRWLDWSIINLGFSGNGCMGIEIAHLLGELDPCVYVLDAMANMSLEFVNERVEPFVKYLKEVRPDTPIVLVENETYQNAIFVPRIHEDYSSRNAALRRIYQALLDEGMTKLHYVEGMDLLGDDGEATVDGVHATDLGFIRMSRVIKPVLAAILG